MLIADENMKMTDCYFEKKDWRVCKKEVCCYPAHSRSDNINLST
jgi:hypothetical protein